MIRVMIVDDERIIRLGLRKIIESSCPGVEVVAQAEDGEEALALTRQFRPDLCIADVRMPRMNGIEYVAKLRELGFQTRVVILSGYAEFSYAQQAIAQGCSGYLLKPVKHEELIELLGQLEAEITAAGDGSRPPERATDLLRRAALEKEAGSLQSDGKDNVTRRIIRNAIRYVELHVDQPVSVSEIATHLGLSPSYFSTLFRRETGDRFISFLIKCKVEKACDMLDHTNLKIYEVGERLGYSDVKYFMKIFRKYTGRTPSQYRDGIEPEQER